MTIAEKMRCNVAAYEKSREKDILKYKKILLVKIEQLSKEGKTECPIVASGCSFDEIPLVRKALEKDGFTFKTTKTNVAYICW